MRANRRSFVKYASLAAAGHALGLRPFAAMNALAQSASDYKALVCVFLYGGNDANNLLIPFDTTGFANYASLRGPLALAQGSVCQLGKAPAFALHPQLPNLASLFDSSKAALIANVGTLIEPTSRAQFQALESIPSNLFSHTDQQLEWQNAAQTSMVSTGWAGRIADALHPSYNAAAQIPMITSVAGDTLFCDGQSTSPLAVTPGNIGGLRCSEGSSECSAQLLTAQAMLTFQSGISLVQADNTITANAYKYSSLLTEAVQSLPALQTVFPSGNGLATQLKQIAQIMQARSALGVNRQIFFASLGSFDTHSGQLSQQANLLSQVNAALTAFYQATQELGIAQNVTSFTMSEFSRAFQPNSANGSDHAWGSHHMVLGGAVKGGQIYGSFPTLALGGPNDSGANGRWIPTTSSAQYAATLAQWFGVSTAQLPIVFPTLSNFATSNLGFV